MVDVTRADDINTLEKLCESQEGTPGGGWIKSSSSSTIKKTLNIACDFIVFSVDTQFNILPKDKIGRILEADLSWSEVLLRTVNDLPVDAIFLAGKDAELTITINRLMQLQRLIYAVNKPILAAVPANISEAELQALWDMGVSAVVVEATDAESAKRLSAIRQDIDKLKPSAARKKARSSPILPRISAEEPKPQEDEEEDE